MRALVSNIPRKNTIPFNQAYGDSNIVRSPFSLAVGDLGTRLVFSLFYGVFILSSFLLEV